MTEVQRPIQDIAPLKRVRGRAMKLTIPTASTAAPVEIIDEQEYLQAHSQFRMGEFASEICPGLLYLGRVEDAQNMEALAKLAITNVLNLAKECESVESPSFVRRLSIPLEDKVGEDLVRVFEEAFKFIDEASKNGGRVLVHCRRGVSRSAAIVVGYLISRKGMTYEDAFEFVKERRRGINPNLGFCLALHELAASL